MLTSIYNELMKNFYSLENIFSKFKIATLTYTYTIIIMYVYFKL